MISSKLLPVYKQSSYSRHHSWAGASWLFVSPIASYIIKEFVSNCLSHHFFLPVLMLLKAGTYNIHLVCIHFNIERFLCLSRRSAALFFYSYPDLRAPSFITKSNNF